MLLDTAMSTGDRTVVVQGERATGYADLADRSLAVAEALTQAGVRPGDRVAVLLRRGEEAASTFGCVRKLL